MVESLSDASLLERFVSDREEAAFVALVRRHGPRVERICRRILRNEHDVEDVFQATFLVLARKAAGVPWRDSVSPWIDGVARRLALHARSGAARQSGRERAVTTLTLGTTEHHGRLPERYHPMVEPSAEVERRDLRRVLDDELLRLPEKYRAPVVLCDLEGHTREEAARRLGWPAGSMSRRLDRARSLLRRRLTHRGVALTTIGVAAIALAAAIGQGPDRPKRVTSVRQVMAPFRSAAEAGDGYGPILAAAAHAEGSQPDFDRIRPAAREAASVARDLEGRVSGPMALLWNAFAHDMNRAAQDVDLACQESNPVALVAAARRLDASCLNCHAVFLRATPASGVPAADPVSFDRPVRRAATFTAPERSAGDARSLTCTPEARRDLRPEATRGREGQGGHSLDVVAAEADLLRAPEAAKAGLTLIPALADQRELRPAASNEPRKAIVTIDELLCSVTAVKWRERPGWHDWG
jgi:RNA polymerase sigma factor (sigma-70 family)